MNATELLLYLWLVLSLNRDINDKEMKVLLTQN